MARLKLVPSRKHNDLLLCCVLPESTVAGEQRLSASELQPADTCDQPEVLREDVFAIQRMPQALDDLVNVWDSPFEPPPFEYRSDGTPCGSTAPPSGFGLGPGGETPLTSTPLTSAPSSRSHSVAS